MKNRVLFPVLLCLSSLLSFGGAVAAQDGQALLEAGAYEAALKFVESQLAAVSAAGAERAALLNLKGNALRELGRYREALSVHEAALGMRLAHLGPSSIFVSNSYQNIGNCWLGLRQADSAIVHLNRAVMVRRALPDAQDALASAYNSLAEAHRQKANLNRAAQYLEEALSLRQGIYGERHIKLAPIYLGLSAVYTEQGKALAAAQMLGQLQIIIEAQTPAQPEWRALAQLGYGHHHQAVDQVKAALQHYQAAATESERLPESHPTQAKCLAALGQYWLYLGEPAAALPHLRRAAGIYQAIGPGYVLDLADLYNDIGLCYRHRKQLPQAIGYHEEAITLYLNSEQRAHTNLYGFYRNIGKCLLQQGSHSAARYYFHQAISGTDPYNDVLALLQIGQSYLSQRAWEEAAANAKQALAFCRKHRLESELPIILAEYQLGRSIAGRDAATALAHYGRGLSAIAASPAPSLYAYEEVMLRTASASCQFQRAWQMGNAEEAATALRNYETALDLLTQMEYAFTDEQSSLLLRYDFADLFDGLIAVCFYLSEVQPQRGYQERAFHYAEAYKAAQLRRSLRGRAPPHRFAVPDSLLAHARYLRQCVHLEQERCRKLERQLLPDAQNLSRQYERLGQAITEYRALRQQLSLAYPTYAKWMQQDSLVTLQQLQTELLPGQTLLEYTLADSVLYVFAVNDSEYRLLRQKLPEDFQEKVERFYLLARTRPDVQTNPSAAAARLIELGHELYEILIDPVQPLLGESCIIVPDRLLCYLPFAALLEAPSATAPHLFKVHPYFGRSQAISYSYSATLLQLMRALPLAPPPATLLAVAPSFDNNPAGLRPLRHNQLEAQRLHQQVPGIYLGGAKAGIERFKAEAPLHRMIHLATHSAMHSEIPEDGFMAFHPGEEGEQGLLYLSEIYSLPLAAELVTLSACQTGIGSLQEGEGLMSVARAFAYAGSRSLVATLWSIDDEQTEAIMEGFYWQIVAGKDKASALQKSQLEYLAATNHDYAHPYYWAAITVIGAPAPLEVLPVSLWWSWKWVSALLAVGFSLAIYLGYQRKSLKENHSALTSTQSLD